MLRAVYDFEPPQASYENTLKFAEKDLFIVIKRDKSVQDWVHVVNLQGENGYAPLNYLTEASLSAAEEFDYINEVLARLSSKKQLNRNQKMVITSLNEWQCKLEKELQELAAKQFYRLASIIRQKTNCQFQDAQMASIASLAFLQEQNVAGGGGGAGIERILKVEPSQIPMEVRKECQDSRHLDRLVGIVMEVADDQETDVTQETWNELLDLVTHCDPALSAAAFERYDCAPILQLIHRFQCETSSMKRKPILQILYHSLQLQSKFLNVAINSVLPEEIARDIQTRCAVLELKDNNDYLVWAVRVLTITVCASEGLSCAQQTELGRAFIELLIRTMEKDQSVAVGAELSSAVMHLILALYRQFKVTSDDCVNPVIDCLSRREMCESLVEKLILLFNREDDPIGNFIQGDALSNSVSLLLIGLFSKVETGHLFYTADLEVVIDIIQRRLKDYGPGDARRSDALKLYNAILRVNSSSDVTYKQSEIAKSIAVIYEESERLGSSSSAMEKDRLEIVKIYHEFPYLKK